MAIPVELAVGEHLILQPVLRWETKASEDRVALTASIRSGSGPEVSPVGATTVALQMDAQVASKLYRQLGELGRSMGWLPPQ